MPSGRSNQVGFRLDKALHVLRPDQRDVVPEPLPVHVDEHLAMTRFFRLHVLNTWAVAG